MDFANITFTIPKANIFSGTEPCLAVVLASVPMMRPLLGPTPYRSGKKPVNAEFKSTDPNGVSDDEFERLNDDTSHPWLRPRKLQHSADASDFRGAMPGNASEGHQEPVVSQEWSGEINGRGIKVKESFSDLRRN